MVCLSVVVLLTENPEVYPTLVEKITCATVSVHLYLRADCRSVHVTHHSGSGTRVFSNWVCYVMKVNNG